MASLSLKHIYKVYDGGVRAVSDFNLEIEDKEFVVFVGLSGCGKSTTLRMIAGLEEITSGELYIGENLVNYTEPKERDIAMVFQNYALYPHMTVFNNMAFGLKLTKMSKDEIRAKVEEAARILDIETLLDRKPKALSGGQRQRVALGRAIVRNPKVFLLDEPLSNLDAKLRVTMRTEITKLHEKLQTTFIYVTHDQTEAMTMGDRIVVMKDGIVQQADTPNTLYNSPANLFVACFLGSPQMNIFKATIVEEKGELYAQIGQSNKVLIPKDRALRIVDRQGIIGKEVLLGIRPEDVHCDAELIAKHPNTVDVLRYLQDKYDKFKRPLVVHVFENNRHSFYNVENTPKNRKILGINSHGNFNEELYVKAEQTLLSGADTFEYNERVWKKIADENMAEELIKKISYGKYMENRDEKLTKELVANLDALSMAEIRERFFLGEETYE